MILCDTNIFFELFRNNPRVIDELDKIGYENLAICDITIGEIYFGMKSSEEKFTKNLIHQFNRYSFTKDASKIFVQIMADLSSRKVGVPDALIAAIAKANSLPILTLNISDFKLIEGIKLYKPTQKLIMI
jgi:tRNA(fMet)-specific endonuclease VapC